MNPASLIRALPVENYVQKDRVQYILDWLDPVLPCWLSILLICSLLLPIPKIYQAFQASILITNSYIPVVSFIMNPASLIQLFRFPVT